MANGNSTVFENPSADSNLIDGTIVLGAELLKISHSYVFSHRTFDVVPGGCLRLGRTNLVSPIHDGSQVNIIAKPAPLLFLTFSD